MKGAPQILIASLALGLVSFAASGQQDGDSKGGDSSGKDDKKPVATKPADEKVKPKAKGTVLFKGELPAKKDLAVPARAAEGCCPPGEEVNRVDRSLLISKERGIANCVVTVTVAGAKVDIPKEPFELDQKGCRFLPHLQVVPAGATVAFLNSDETSHNVHLKTVVNDALNQTVLGGKKIEVKFEKAERIKVTCDMHAWMNAWVIVTDATHFAVTDENGAFAIEGLPAGEHDVKIWHEKLGSKAAKIVVDEKGEAKPIEIQLEKKKKKKGRRRR